MRFMREGKFLPRLDLGLVQDVCGLKPGPLKLMLAIIYTRSVERSTQSFISNKRANDFSLSRASKYRSLQILVDSGTVNALNRGKSCSIIIFTRELKPRVRTKYVEAMRLDWLTDICKLGGGAIRTGLCIHYSKYFEEDGGLIIPNERFEEFNVSRQSKVVSLRILQEAGFIEYTPTPGRNPIIHIVRSSTPKRVLVRSIT